MKMNNKGNKEVSSYVEERKLEEQGNVRAEESKEEDRRRREGKGKEGKGGGGKG